MAEEPNLLDNLWLRRQVETHLFFGFFARRFAFGWIPVMVAGLAMLAALAESWPVLLGRVVTGAVLLALLMPVLRTSRYRQAALGWWVTKASIALVSFLFLLVGGLVGFFRGQPDAIHFALLALLWFPGLEFVPSLVPWQRFITLGRIALSVPIVVLGLEIR
jgi:hypothetical protein